MSVASSPHSAAGSLHCSWQVERDVCMPQGFALLPAMLAGLLSAGSEKTCCTPPCTALDSREGGDHTASS